MNLINNIIVKNYSLRNNINLFFSVKKSLIYIKGFYGFIVLKLYKYYYYYFKKDMRLFILLYNGMKNFSSFLKNFILSYNKLRLIYSIKIKLRGLGLKIRKVTKNLYYFFFNYINIYYIYIPNNLLIKWYKKRIILLSNDLMLIKIIFSQILLLKKLGAYRTIGIRYPRQIILIKKGGKKK